MTRNEFGDYVDDDREGTVDSDECKRLLALWASSEPCSVVIKAMDGTVTMRPLAR